MRAPLTSEGQAAINGERRAGDVAGFGSDEKGDRCRDLLRLPVSAERRHAPQHLRHRPLLGAMSVLMGPGWTTFTVILRAPRSRAQPRV